MQFIVRPSTQYEYIQIPRHFRPLLYLVAFAAFFTSGLMVGVTLMWDGGGSNGLSQPNLQLPCPHSLPSRETTGKDSDTRSGAHESSPPSTKTNTFLVVLILSAANYAQRRDTIRETWLSYPTNSSFQTYFAIGIQDMNPQLVQQLHDENARTSDLLLLPDSADGYSSLTTKLLKSFIWISENVSFSYLLKVDDDSFAQIDILISELTTTNRHPSDHQPNNRNFVPQSKLSLSQNNNSNSLLSENRLYWGFFDGRARVKSSGQWEQRDWFLCDRYLPYALGGGYVLSADLVGYLAHTAEYLQAYLSEDVSLGAWLAPLQIHRVHDIRFDTEYKSRGCSARYLVTHKQSTEEMRRKFAARQLTGSICGGSSGEKSTRQSYYYQWNTTVASECCHRSVNDVTALNNEMNT